jgi:hypothetical protein
MADGTPIQVVDLRNGTGSMQAVLSPSLVPPGTALEVGMAIHVRGIAEPLWEDGPLTLRVTECRPVRPLEVLENALRSSAGRAEYPSGILGMEPGFAAYLLWLVATDLQRWGPSRRTRLTREEVLGFALFLHDALPPELRTPVPTAPAPAPKRQRRGQAA